MKSAGNRQWAMGYREKKKPLPSIFLFIVLIMFAGASLVQGAESKDVSCTHVIMDNYQTKCIDGYEWLVKYETFGCHTAVVPVAQKFEIAYKRNGQPGMSLPVRCADVSVPTVEE